MAVAYVGIAEFELVCGHSTPTKLSTHEEFEMIIALLRFSSLVPLNIESRAGGRKKVGGKGGKLSGLLDNSQVSFHGETT